VSAREEANAYYCKIRSVHASMREEVNAYECERRSVHVSAREEVRMYVRVHTFVLMHHCQNNLEACAARATDLGIESLDMSAKCMEFVKRGCKEYKVLEVLVKGWKAKAVEVVSEAPPKKCATRASKAKATDASIKVHLHDFILALLLRGGVHLACN
jgi:hypothetical protein